MKVLLVNTVPYITSGTTAIIMSYYHELKNSIKFDFIVNEYMEDHIREKINEDVSTIFFLPPRKRKPLQYILKLREITKLNDYDIIHIHGNSSLMAIDLIGISSTSEAKIIVHNHSTQSDYGFFEKLTRFYFHKNYDKAITVELEDSYLFKNKEHVVLNNGINIEKFRFDGLKRESIRLSQGLINETLFLHIGRMDDNKNHLFLLDVFKEYKKKNKDAQLFLVGSGELREKIISKISDNGLENSVKLIGDVENVQDWYSAADVFLFPSKFESFGLVGLEAQVNGLPCIFSSNISKKIKVSNNVRYLQLDMKYINEWCFWLEKYSNITREIGNHEKLLSDEILKYDIKHSALKLKEVYESLLPFS